MNDETVKIGIVGAGRNTREKHIPGFLAEPNVEIVSVCNRSRQSSQKVADQYNIQTVYDDWQQLVNAQDTNAILIGTWPYMHCQVTLAALAAKKHVLCEARMAINLEEAQKMHKAAQQNPNLVTQVVPSPMTLEYDQTIIDLIKQDRLGRILAVELKAAGRFIDPDEPMHWRYDIELSGLNTMSLGIWYESLMRWIGPAKKVSAMAKTFVKKRKDDKNKTHKIQIPDHLDIIAEMDCGAMALMRFSQVTGCDDGPKVSLFGSKATLTLAGDKLLFGTRQENKLREITINPEKRGKWRVEKEFINAIRSKEKVKLTTFKNGLKYMEFTEAAIKSARTAQTIDLS